MFYLYISVAIAAAIVLRKDVYDTKTYPRTQISNRYTVAAAIPPTSAGPSRSDALYLIRIRKAFFIEMVRHSIHF